MLLGGERSGTQRAQRTQRAQSLQREGVLSENVIRVVREVAG